MGGGGNQVEPPAFSRLFKISGELFVRHSKVYFVRFLRKKKKKAFLRQRTFRIQLSTGCVTEGNVFCHFFFCFFPPFLPIFFVLLNNCGRCLFIENSVKFFFLFSFFFVVVRKAVWVPGILRPTQIQKPQPPTHFDH